MQVAREGAVRLLLRPQVESTMDGTGMEQEVPIHPGEQTQSHEAPSNCSLSPPGGAQRGGCEAEEERVEVCADNVATATVRVLSAPLKPCKYASSSRVPLRPIPPSADNSELATIVPLPALRCKELLKAVLTNTEPFDEEKTGKATAEVQETRRRSIVAML